MRLRTESCADAHLSTPSSSEARWALSTVSWRQRVLVFAVLTGVLGFVWFPLLPKYLHDCDAANFALSLDEFNPRLHQPQPPGYPLFVGLLRLIYWFVPKLPRRLDPLAMAN